MMELEVGKERLFGSFVVVGNASCPPTFVIKRWVDIFVFWFCCWFLLFFGLFCFCFCFSFVLFLFCFDFDFDFVFSFFFLFL